MKLHLIILLLTTTLSSYAQDEDSKHISAGIGAGWMAGVAAEAQVSYSSGPLSANVGFITPLKFQTDDRQVLYFKPEFAFRIGDSGAIGFGAGYCVHFFKHQQWQDTELKPGLTTMGIIFSLRYIREMNERSAWYIGASTTRAVVAFTTGIRINIININKKINHEYTKHR